jgi:hypothetical protein
VSISGTAEEAAGWPEAIALILWGIVALVILWGVYEIVQAVEGGASDLGSWFTGLGSGISGWFTDTFGSGGYTGDAGVGQAEGAAVSDPSTPWYDSLGAWLGSIE